MRRFLILSAGLGSLLASSTALAGPYDAWLYQRATVVSNASASALSGYQARLTIDTAALVASGRLQADGSDLRFATSDDSTPLPYWVEGGMNTASTVVWVRVPSLAAGGSTEIALVSGASGQTDASSAAATFDLWEPFDDPASPIFAAEACGSGNATIASGTGTFGWSSAATWSARKGGPNDDGTFPLSDVYRIDAAVTAASGSWPGIHWDRATDFGGYSMLLGGGNVRIGEGSSARLSYCDGENWASSLQSSPANVSGIWSLAWIDTAKIWGSFPNLADFTSTSATHPRDQALRVVIGGISSGPGSMTFDWIRVRKYAPSEPTWAFGSETLRIPQAPTLTSADAGALQASLSFSPALSNFGPVTGYTADCGGVTATGQTSPIVVSGLTAGTPYSCTVTAQNAAGSSPASNAISVTPFTSPGSPTVDSATPGDGTVTVAFSPPADDGGNDVTGYTLDCGAGGNVSGASSPLTLSGLTNGTEYTCTVTAENAAGTGAASGEVKVTPRTVPGAPTLVTAAPGNAQASFTFTPPADNGGSAITGYAVACTPAGGAGGTGPASPLTLTSLANGTAYTCSVTATNAAGASAPSNALTVTPVAPPVPDAGDTSTPPVDAGPPATEQDAGALSDPAVSADTGCGCRVVGETPMSWHASALAALAAVLASARRIRRRRRDER